MMTRAIRCIGVILLLGCSTLAGQSRLEKFSEIAQTYEQALRMADYNAAARFIDPTADRTRRGLDLQSYQNIKIVEYKILHVDVSPDNLEIKQDVELQYFLLNSNIIRTTRHPQTWRFQEKDKIWLLQTQLPDFTH